MTKERFSFESVEKAVRKKSFGVLTTINSKGRPHSTGIIYGVSPPTSPFALYILVGKNYAKVRNIKANNQVSLVVTFPHYWLRFVPASYAMFRGTAELVSFNNIDARWSMSQSRIGRMNLATDVSEDEMVFIKINPEPTIFCYGLGISIMEMRGDHTNAGYKATIPPERMKK
ncbi:MAG: pyridoxamine 5'-phosphate oxidase family protein [Candidatus Thorarchaeota archaeon]|nr:pyridoxamine 5'-phosphate oxidase family protein [Candidatus Thorarchaeota archaeon]